MYFFLNFIWISSDSKRHDFCFYQAIQRKHCSKFIDKRKLYDSPFFFLHSVSFFFSLPIIERKRRRRRRAKKRSIKTIKTVFYLLLPIINTTNFALRNRIFSSAERGFWKHVVGLFVYGLCNKISRYSEIKRSSTGISNWYYCIEMAWRHTKTFGITYRNSRFENIDSIFFSRHFMLFNYPLIRKVIISFVKINPPMFVEQTKKESFLLKNHFVVFIFKEIECFDLALIHDTRTDPPPSFSVRSKFQQLLILKLNAFSRVTIVSITSLSVLSMFHII